VPEPGRGEVLIKVLASPINPSDIHFMMGYKNDTFKIHYPNVPGWEGCGVVVKSGGGITTWGWVGKRVTFTRKLDGTEKILGGAYQQYIVTDAFALINQTDNNLPDEVCAT
jgi:NADPH:quinone reductase-like Zn-dependent oxidoreductase